VYYTWNVFSQMVALCRSSLTGLSLVYFQIIVPYNSYSGTVVYVHRPDVQMKAGQVLKVSGYIKVTSSQLLILPL
jgi:hypothetical protein